MSSRTITPRGPFRLDAATTFLHGFTPAGYDRPDDGHLHLAIIVEGAWEPAAVCATTDGYDVHVESAGPGAGDQAEDQLVRILSLDLDATEFEAVCATDPVLADARSRHPGLRPVLFPSTYEALAWALLSQRVRMAQALAAVRRIADALGTPVSIHGDDLVAFPTPTALAKVEPMRGVPQVKVDRLRALGPAVVDGDLTATSLRDDESALERLTTLDGIGPFSAALALVRGVGAPDHFPREERRLHAIMRDRYGLDDASVEDLADVADAWRPFRSWAALLLRNDGADPA